MLDGILYRVCKDQLTGKKRWQYVVPASLTEQVLLGVYDKAGHQGQARTLYLARERFFWVDMERDVREYVKCCKRCVVSKTPEPEARAPLESVRTTRPLELVCIPTDSTDTQDGVCTDVIMPGARERHRAISTLSISSAPPNVSEVVTQLRTRVGRLVRPVNRLIQNMTQKTTHSAVKSLLF
ncbi:hypothetical protein QQF64_036437 [Cirrhinus molitorella]|uniref:Gypsy retrotransposon integrase-like protein 1 n=1 Tax=Cirrhinus molitorella TaxID=172907 RepID=A0ABR3NIS8_9TELE